MDKTALINFKIVKDLNESIAYVSEKNSHIELPELTAEEKTSIDSLLMEYYRESRIICISYRDRGRIQSYTGIIDRIDLIYKELFLLPKKKIPFSMIVGVKQ